MPRYLVEAATKLKPLQAGDYPQPLSFLVPIEVLPMTGKGAIFIMHDENDVEMMSRDSDVQGEIIIEDQLITIPLTVEDTEDRSEICHWWLKAKSEGELITIGYGTVQINILR